MDLSTIKPTGRTVEITHPATGAPLGLRFEVVSLDDDSLKRTKRNITDEQLRLNAKGKSWKAEELERNGRNLLFAATKGWTWYNPTGSEGDDGYDPNATAKFNGEQPDYNQKNFIELIETLPWIGDQLRETLDDTKSFFDI